MPPNLIFHGVHLKPIYITKVQVEKSDTSYGFTILGIP